MADTSNFSVQPTTVYLDKPLKTRLQRLAKARRQSLSAFITTICEDKIEPNKTERPTAPKK